MRRRGSKTGEFWSDVRDRDLSGISEAEAENEYYARLGVGLGNELAPVIKCFAAARKTNRIAPSVLVRFVEYVLQLDRSGRRRFTDNDILDAVREWFEKRFHEEGYREDFFRGMLRRVRAQKETRRRLGLRRM